MVPEDSHAHAGHGCGRRAALFAAALLCMAPWPAAGQDDAQEGWLPATHYFAAPIADPREPRFAAALVVTDLFSPAKPPPEERLAFFLRDRADAETEVLGGVAFGGTLPVWAKSDGDGGGISLGIRTGVFARFRIEQPSRDLVGTDWIVAAPLEVKDGRFSMRFEIMHWSAHLGDELVRDGAQRIEFGRDGFDWIVGYDVLDGTRVYGGGSWIFHSNTEQEPIVLVDVTDDVAFQVGFDVERYPWADGRLGYVAGLDFKNAQRTDWDGQIAVVTGPAARIGRGRARLTLRYFDGPSPMGEFFLTEEQYWAIDIEFALFGGAPR